MTARLPIPGSDDGTWGAILNDYLSVEHNADGSLKNVVRPSSLATITADVDAKLAAQAATDAGTYIPKGALCVNVKDYGAKGDGSTDDTAAIQNAVNAGRYVIFPASTGSYRFESPVTIPAGTTLAGNGVLKPILLGQLTTGGTGCSFLGLAFDFTSEATMVGQERALSIRHAQTTIDRCSFSGNGYRYGIVIEGPGGTGSCDEARITNCTFTTTSYGILKNGGGGTTANCLCVKNCRFSHIRRGDAIEINIGQDVGYDISYNSINDVTDDGVASAGLGIGIAGGGSSAYYGNADLTTETRNFDVSHNRVSNVSSAAIHVEACNSFEVAYNEVWQESTLVGTASGIQLFGVRDGRTTHNFASGFEYGIQDDLGVLGGAYIAGSSNRTMIDGNEVLNCKTGIFSGLAGELLSATIQSNRVTSCPVGIRQSGGAAVRFWRNQVLECPVPFSVDVEPAVKGAFNATYSKNLEFVDNTALRGGVGQQGASVFTNYVVSYTPWNNLVESGNNFVVAGLAALPVPRIFNTTDMRDFHAIGDILINPALDSPIEKYICTAGGYQQGHSSDSYFFTATAGKDYVVITYPGDPSGVFKVGQQIYLYAAGPASVTLTTFITQIYIANSEYRIRICDTIGTTVPSSTAVMLSSVSTFVPVYRTGRTANVITKSAAYNAVMGDGTILANGTFTITLPSAATATTGVAITVKNIGSGTVTVAAAAGTVDVTSITASAVYNYISNGTNWYAC